MTRRLDVLTEPGSVNSASMRQDLEAGRRTEADAIVGDMLRRARGSGIATPLLSCAAFVPPSTTKTCFTPGSVFM